MQPPLFSRHNPPDFGGSTYEPEHDQVRLTGQRRRVWSAVKDGQWRTLSEIAAAAKGSEPAISARLRDLRKAEFGGHQVERRRRGNPKSGLFEYRVISAEQRLATCSPSSRRRRRF